MQRILRRMPTLEVILAVIFRAFFAFFKLFAKKSPFSFFAVYIFSFARYGAHGNHPRNIPAIHRSPQMRTFPPRRDFLFFFRKAHSWEVRRQVRVIPGCRTFPALTKISFPSLSFLNAEYGKTGADILSAPAFRLPSVIRVYVFAAIRRNAAISDNPAFFRKFFRVGSLDF